MTLQFDVEAVAEHPLHFRRGRRRRRRRVRPAANSGSHGPSVPPDSSDQALGMIAPQPTTARAAPRRDRCRGRPRRTARTGCDSRLRFERAAQSSAIFAQRSAPGTADPGYRQSTADDRLDPGVLGQDGKLEGAEQIGAIREADSGHSRIDRQLADGIDFYRALPAANRPISPADGRTPQLPPLQAPRSFATQVANCAA